MKHIVHPGEILNDELDALELSAAALARALNVPANRITQILRGQRSITGDTALRLGHWFNMNPLFWLNLQTAYDLGMARRTASAEIETLPQLAAG